MEYMTAKKPKRQHGESGRPTKKTPEVIKKIEEVAALDGSVEEMAYYAGIHRETLYAWLKGDKKFSDRIQELRERPVLKARQTIVQSLNDADKAFKYMEKKRRKEFGNAIDITSGGEKLPTPILNAIPSNYSISEDTLPD